MKEKKLEKGFAFGYGSENFGYELDLSQELEFNTKINEGYGIAFINQKHMNLKKAKRIKIEIKNISTKNVIIRIEKKFYNDVKTGFELLSPNSSKKIYFELCQEDTAMKELVVALLRNENEEVHGRLKVTATVYE